MITAYFSACVWRGNVVMEKDTIGGGGGGRFKLLNLHKDVDTPDEKIS